MGGAVSGQRGPEVLVHSRPLAHSRPHRDQGAEADDSAAERSPTNHGPGAKDPVAQRTKTGLEILAQSPTTEEMTRTPQPGGSSVATACTALGGVLELVDSKGPGGRNLGAQDLDLPLLINFR